MIVHINFNNSNYSVSVTGTMYESGEAALVSTVMEAAKKIIPNFPRNPIISRSGETVNSYETLLHNDQILIH